MRSVCKTIAAPIIALAVGFLELQCGSPGGTPLSGGSGAGNPAGTVALSMVASAESALPKRLGRGGQAVDIVDLTKPIVAIDRSGLRLVITALSLSNVNVHFTLDTEEVPSRLLSSMRDRRPELSIDTHSIVLSGPYRFNAIQGNVDSSIRTLSLPVARYTGVKLLFDRDSVSGEQFGSQIVMNGTFADGGDTHAVRIDLTNRSWPWYQQTYRFAGGIFTLSQTDTTNLQLQFNPKKWFSEVDLGWCIDRGILFAGDSTDTVVISNRSSRSPSQEIGNTIFKSFIASGRLVVF
jgi:hypothetical protein